MKIPKPLSYKHQHFLNNSEILKKQIKIAQLKKSDKVIEIGAGDGRLSKLIAPKVKQLTSFETDTRFKPLLKNLKNTKFIFDNAIKYSWKNHNKIVANIPYSLSEQIILKSIKEEIKELTLIIGENFRKNIKENSSNIAILTNIFYTFFPIQKISKKEFSPQPKINSHLIQLKRKSNPLLQNIFTRKGKIKNAILYSLVQKGQTKNEAREIIQKLNIKKEILENSTRTLNGKFLLELKNSLKELDS
jgi:16S rRNA A1518/A1519 N6-dimethyltransferase RsmA/KsgA/DIM1 with predicted DNA glycosylase/AP lyase activity